ncbi:hypothetical protein [Pseudomonas triticicola]|uniref:hypothetical protein n=1 Tax=Pseudomonas triticicola TaxID=2842345 RepID=UPI003EBCFAAF
MSTVKPAISEEVLSDWHEMQSAQTCSGLVLKIEPSRMVITDKKLVTDNSDDLMFALEENDCRFALWRYPGTTKIFFIFWSPYTAKVRSKMIYNSACQGLKSLFTHDVYIQATDSSELSEESLRVLVDLPSSDEE